MNQTNMLSLVLFISFISTALGELIPKSCNECVPILLCPEALKWVNVTNKETTQILRQAYCGKSDKTFLICCSDFQTTQEKEHPNSKLLPTSCGNSYYPRILGGRGSSLYEFPWMALISDITRDGLQFRCSGTVINSHYILTAASCVVGMRIAGVRIGEYNIQQEFDCVGGICESTLQDKRIEMTIFHPDYIGPPKFAHNIALLRVDEKIDFSFKNAGPICLPWTKDLISESLENKLAIVAGWGLTDNNLQSSIIHKAATPILLDNECRNLYRDVYENSTVVCAGTRERETCVGDIGGPLMIETTHERTQRFVQYGILSNGPVQCGSDNPGIYTDVRKYMNWILDNIKE